MVLEASLQQKNKKQQQSNITQDLTFDQLIDPTYSLQQYIDRDTINENIVFFEGLQEEVQRLNDIPNIEDQVLPYVSMEYLLPSTAAIDVETQLANTIVNNNNNDNPEAEEHIQQELIDEEREENMTMKQYYELLTQQQLQQQQRQVIANRKALVKKIVGAVIGGIVAVGLWTLFASGGLVAISATAASAAGSGAGLGFGLQSLPLWFQSIYTFARTLGLDQAAIHRLFLVLKRNRYMNHIGKKQPVPLVLQRWLKKAYVPPSVYEASLEVVMEKFVSEGIALTNIGNVSSYMTSTLINQGINKGISVGIKGGKLLKEAAQKTTNAIRKIVTPTNIQRAVAKVMTSQKINNNNNNNNNSGLYNVIEEMSEQVENELQNTLSHTQKQLVEQIDRSKTETQEQVIVNTLTEPKVVAQAEETKQQDTETETTETFLQKSNQYFTQASLIGTTVAVALYRGQIADSLVNISQNETVQNMAFSLLTSATGLNHLVAKCAGRLTVSTLNKIKDINKPFLTTTKKTENAMKQEKSEAVKLLFTLLLGKHIYSNEEIQRMAITDIKNVFTEHGVELPKKKMTRQQQSSVAYWRKLLDQHQQDMFQLTQQQLVENIAYHLAHGATSLATTTLYQSYGSMILESVNTASISRMVGLTSEEINAINVSATANPTFIEQHLVQPQAQPAIIAANELEIKAVQGIEKINNFLQENPDVAAELQQAPVSPPPPPPITKDATIVGEAAEIAKMKTFQKHKLKVQQLFHLTDEQVAPAKNLQELNQLINQLPKNLNTTNNNNNNQIELGSILNSDGTVFVNAPQTNNADNIQRRAQIKAIREERQARAAILREQQNVQTQLNLQRHIDRFATKYQLAPEQVAGIQNLQQLQQLIQTKLSTTTVRAQGPRAVELGNLTEDQLISKKLAEHFKQIEFSPLYTTLRNTAIRQTTSYIPGFGAFTEKINLGIEAINVGKQTYNVGVALNQLLRFNEFVADNAPYLPTMDIPKLPSIADAIINALPEAKKVNVYNVFLDATIKKIQHSWSQTEFILEIAAQVAGKDAAVQDLQTVIQALTKVL